MNDASRTLTHRKDLKMNNTQTNIDKDNKTLVESFGHNAVEPIADDAAELPDGADTGEPEKHEDACNINWKSDAVILGAEDLNGKIDEDSWNKIGSETDAFQNSVVDSI